jgi:hypothetical protein
VSVEESRREVLRIKRYKLQQERSTRHSSGDRICHSLIVMIGGPVEELRLSFQNRIDKELEEILAWLRIALVK